MSFSDLYSKGRHKSVFWEIVQFYGQCNFYLGSHDFNISIEKYFSEE